MYQVAVALVLHEQIGLWPVGNLAYSSFPGRNQGVSSTPVYDR